MQQPHFDHTTAASIADSTFSTTQDFEGIAVEHYHSQPTSEQFSVAINNDFIIENPSDFPWTDHPLFREHVPTEVEDHSLTLPSSHRTASKVLQGSFPAANIPFAGQNLPT